MEQFEKLLEFAEKFNSAKVVFGGDFNMRDAELKRLENKRDFFHTNIVDTWDNSEDNRYTWDLSKFVSTARLITCSELNDNKKLPFTARCRFDRLYCNRNVTACDFKLSGKEKIKHCPITNATVNRFVSDHFAITATLQ